MIHKRNNAKLFLSRAKVLTLVVLFSLTALILPFQVLGQDESGANGSPKIEGLSDDDAVIASGGELFTNYCASCHAVKKKVVGPALQNVWERVELPWIVNFVHNSQKVIKSGDPYAVKLYNEYNKTQMTAFPGLKEDQIAAIISWVKAETFKKEVAAGPVAADGEAGEQTGGSGISETTFYILVGALAFVTLLVIFVLILIVTLLKKFASDKTLTEEDKEVLDQGFSLGNFLKSPGVVGLVIFAFVAIGAKTGIDGLYTVGVQQGYQPEQPINFSHKIHAGQYEIDCQYCHTGVRKSKSANIPSANICMNCHTQIKTKSPEIQKIHKAIDYDVETNTYGTNVKPIKWVRIHNLPDLAYFNHAQHVKVGGLDCENCHGPIQEMEKVYQYSNLTMGWCIDCHRKTEINVKGNAYYDNILELHQKAKNPDHNNAEPIHVEDMGGTECSKCHY